MIKKIVFIGVILGIFLGFILLMGGGLMAQQAKTLSPPEPPPPPQNLESKFMIIHTVKVHSDEDQSAIQKFAQEEFLPALKKLRPEGRLKIYLLKGSKLEVDDEEYEIPADIGIVELWDTAENAGQFWNDPPVIIDELTSRKNVVSGPLDHKFSFYEVIE